MDDELEEEVKKLIKDYLEKREVKLEDLLRIAADALYELAKTDENTFKKIMIAWQLLLLIAK